MSKKLTKEEFIERAKLLYEDKYIYDLTEYINNKTKVKIICKKHGVFEQSPGKHINSKHGCPICGADSSHFKKRKKQSDFIKEAEDVHGNKYDYSLVEYKNSNEFIRIICPIHGEFKQKPVNHLKCGCPICGAKKASDSRILSKEYIIEEAKKVHGETYNYDLVEYKGKHSKIKIICKKHGVFEQSPHNHINDSNGCPICKSSKGEIKVKCFLTDNNILFEEQKKFKDCFRLKKLRFDFYIPELKIAIEYNGKQHYEAVSLFGGKKGLLETIERDNIKRKYCLENNIKLIEIKYDESIEERLREIL